MVEKMLYLKEHMDWIRTSLMFEPRGHSIMSGVILLEPSVPDADYGVIFIETGGYLPMCGHDTIGVCTALVEAGMVDVQEPETRITLDTPAGLTNIVVHVENGKACSVTFRNIPSFVIAQDVCVDVPGYGGVILDVSYGGNPYAIVSADLFDLALVPENASAIIKTGRLVRDAVNAQVKVLC
jgi:proline racemase